MEWVDYEMAYAPNGYFIHDAWWQQNLGSEGNLKTGSHGCINVPPAAMRPRTCGRVSATT